MLLSAVPVLVVAQSSSEFPEGLMNNPVCFRSNLSLYCLQVNAVSQVPDLILRATLEGFQI